MVSPLKKKRSFKHNKTKLRKRHRVRINTDEDNGEDKHGRVANHDEEVGRIIERRAIHEQLMTEKIEWKNEDKIETARKTTEGRMERGIKHEIDTSQRQYGDNVNETDEEIDAGSIGQSESNVRRKKEVKAYDDTHKKGNSLRSCMKWLIEELKRVKKENALLRSNLDTASPNNISKMKEQLCKYKQKQSNMRSKYKALCHIHKTSLVELYELAVRESDGLRNDICLLNNIIQRLNVELSQHENDTQELSNIKFVKLTNRKEIHIFEPVMRSYENAIADRNALVEKYKTENVELRKQNRTLEESSRDLRRRVHEVESNLVISKHRMDSLSINNDLLSEQNEVLIHKINLFNSTINLLISKYETLEYKNLNLSKKNNSLLRENKVLQGNQLQGHKLQAPYEKLQMTCPVDELKVTRQRNDVVRDKLQRKSEDFFGLVQPENAEEIVDQTFELSSRTDDYDEHVFGIKYEPYEKQSVKYKLQEQKQEANLNKKQEEMNEGELRSKEPTRYGNERDAGENANREAARTVNILENKIKQLNKEIIILNERNKFLNTNNLVQHNQCINRAVHEKIVEYFERLFNELVDKYKRGGNDAGNIEEDRARIRETFVEYKSRFADEIVRGDSVGEENRNVAGRIGSESRNRDFDEDEKAKVDEALDEMQTRANVIAESGEDKADIRKNNESKQRDEQNFGYVRKQHEALRAAQNQKQLTQTTKERPQSSAPMQIHGRSAPMPRFSHPVVPCHRHTNQPKVDEIKAERFEHPDIIEDASGEKIGGGRARKIIVKRNVVEDRPIVSGGVPSVGRFDRERRQTRCIGSIKYVPPVVIGSIKYVPPTVIQASNAESMKSADASSIKKHTGQNMSEGPNVDERSTTNTNERNAESTRIPVSAPTNMEATIGNNIITGAEETKEELRSITSNTQIKAIEHHSTAPNQTGETEDIGYVRETNEVDLEEEHEDMDGMTRL